MKTSINEQLIEQLSQFQNPQELIAESFRLFGTRCAIGTSGQLSGSVIIDMACQSGLQPRVFTIDTLRLFKETYDLFSQIESKYKIKIERIKPNNEKLDQMIKQNGEYLFFDSKEKQELCCHIRKVEPNNEALKTLDIWITGLRTDQSGRRSKTPQLQLIKEPETGRPILKISPLLHWSEAKIRSYIATNDVPTHTLLDYNKNGWFYESLGCKICTTPISQVEPRRAGRWRWFNALDPSSKECGLHSADNTDND